MKKNREQYLLNLIRYLYLCRRFERKAIAEETLAHFLPLFRCKQARLAQR